MISKKVVNILFGVCIISALSFFVFAEKVGGGNWTVGYCEENGDDIIYSEYLHNTKPHGASTQVYNETSWETDRICVARGVIARSEQKDNYRHSSKHGHGFWHRCGIDIENCNGAFENFDY